MISQEQFLSTIEAFLERTGMTPTLFGVEAMGDPMFVFDLRTGRECRRATREKAAGWMAKNPDGVKRAGDAA